MLINNLTLLPNKKIRKRGFLFTWNEIPNVLSTTVAPSTSGLSANCLQIATKTLLFQKNNVENNLKQIETISNQSTAIGMYYCGFKHFLSRLKTFLTCRNV